MNIVHVGGNLGADPELKISSSGVAVLKLRVASNERVKKGEEWVDHTEWHNITMFGKRAEALARILAKGSKVFVTGSLRTSSWEHEGQKRYRTEIIGNDLEIGGGGKKQTSEEPVDLGDTNPVDDAEIPF